MHAVADDEVVREEPLAEGSLGILAEFVVEPGILEARPPTLLGFDHGRGHLGSPQLTGGRLGQSAEPAFGEEAGSSECVIGSRSPRRSSYENR